MTTDVAEVTPASPAVTPVVDDAPSTEELAEASAALGHEAAPAAPEAAATGTEPEAQDEDLQALVEATRQSAAEAAREEGRRTAQAEADTARRTEQARRQLDGIDRAFRNRAQSLRNYGQQQGWTAEAINAVVNEFNAHHAQMAPVRDAAWWDYTLQYVQDKMPDAATAIRGDYEAGKIEDFHQLLDRIADTKAATATTGRYTEAQVKEREQLAFIRGKRQAQKAGENGAVSVPRSRTVPGTPRSDDEILLDPASSIEEVNAALKRKGAG